MSRSPLSRWFVAWLASLVLALAGSLARAQASGLPAVISAGASGLSAADIRSAVEHELRVPLVLAPTAAKRLEIAVTGRRANVTYYAPGREPVTRSVDLPRDEPRALETIAFLAGNLARDEAAELLSELAPPEAAPEPAAVPSAPVASPPPPVPDAGASAPPRKHPVHPAGLARRPSSPRGPAPAEPDPVGVNLSLYYPLTLRPNTAHKSYHLELGLVYSKLGGISGAAGTLGYLDIEGPSRGFSYAAFWNRTGPLRGFQASHLVNEGHGPLEGVSAAGLVDVRDGRIQGVQGAGLVAIAGDFQGLEVAGVVAKAGAVEGLQLGGVVGVARGVRGAQVAPVVAVATDVEGLQVGLVNVGGRVRGVQIGLVNVADEIHGGAIGLLNIAGNGRLQGVLWLPGPDAPPMAGVKSITDHTYSLLGFGYDPFQERYRSDASFGLHLDLGHGFAGETGIGCDTTHRVRSSSGRVVGWTAETLVRQNVRWDVRVGFEPVRGITPFIGASVNRRLGGGGAGFRAEYTFGLALL